MGKSRPNLPVEYKIKPIPGGRPNNPPGPHAVSSLTKQAFERMQEEFAFDPLKESIAIARGEALTKDHPLLPILLDVFEAWRERSAAGKKIEIEDINRIQEKCIIMLTDSWVSHEIRSKHVQDLLSYVYPKRKAMDVNHGGTVSHDINLKPLTKEDMVAFNEKFDIEY